MNTGAMNGSAIARGMSLATDSALAFVCLGFVGAIFALGYDGLAFGLGLAGGLAILALIVSPKLNKFEGRSVSTFLAEHFESSAIGWLAAGVVIVAAFMFLAAHIAGAGMAVALLTGIEPALCVVVAGAVLLLVFVAHVLRATHGFSTLIFVTIFAVFLIIVVALSVALQGFKVPPPVFVSSLASAHNLEPILIEQKLADPRSLRAVAMPFLFFDVWNFGALLICLIAGCAVLPTALRGLAGAPSVAQAQSSAVWGLTFVVGVLLLVPAIATFAKLAVYQLVAAGTKLSELPEWVFWLGKSGLAQVCGRDAINLDVVVAACSKVSGQRGVLRLQDLTIVQDAIAMTATDIVGLPRPFAYLSLGGVLLACAAGANAVLGVVASVIGGRTERQAAETGTLPFPLIVALIVGLAAIAAALAGPGDIVTLFAWSVSLLAAGLFPAVLAALFWPRAHPRSVLLAMLVGFGLTLYYVVATRYFAPHFFSSWSFFSNASTAAVNRFGLLEQAVSSGSSDAAREALDRHSRSIANWWGIKNPAAGIFGLFLGSFIIVGGSLLFPRTRSPSKKMSDGGLTS